MAVQKRAAHYWRSKLLHLLCFRRSSVFTFFLSLPFRLFGWILTKSWFEIWKQTSLSFLPSFAFPFSPHICPFNMARPLPPPSHSLFLICTTMQLPATPKANKKLLNTRGSHQPPPHTHTHNEMQADCANMQPVTLGFSSFPLSPPHVELGGSREVLLFTPQLA